MSDVWFRWRNWKLSLFNVFWVFCCCKCQGYVRWAVHGVQHEHPVLSFKVLDHNHPVNKGVVDEVRRQTKPLDTPTKEACVKLTGKYRGRMCVICILAFDTHGNMRCCVSLSGEHRTLLPSSLITDCAVVVL